MIVYIIAMVAILAIAAVVAGVVMVGIEGRGRARWPRIAAKLSDAAKHLNGDEAPNTVSAQQHRQHSRRTPAGHL